MPLVYIVNRGPHDYRGAESFGELVFCTEGALDKYDTAQMYREMTEALHDSCEDDYILLTSLTSLCCVAVAIFVAKHQRVNFLIHRSDGYISRTLHLNNLG